MKQIINSLKSRLWLVVVLVIVVLAPLVMPEYWVLMCTEAVIVTLFALSFNLLFGYMGEFSFGQAAYFGAGAYTAVLMISKVGAPFLLSIPAAVVIASLWALIGGFLCVRLSGIYFAIMTIVITQITFIIVYEWVPMTGGADGFRGGAPPEMLMGALPFYYFALAIVIPAIVAYWFIVRSPFGTTLRCMRDNAERTLFLGVSVRKHMLAAFVVAGAYAGLSGALFGIFNRGTSPFYCDFMKSGDPVFMTILGGAYTFGGPILGAVIWALLDYFASTITEYWPFLIGVLILLVILFMRQGILGTLEQGLRQFRQRQSNKAPPNKGSTL